MAVIYKEMDLTSTKSKVSYKFMVKTKKELTAELEALRKRNAELEKAEAQREKAEKMLCLLSSQTLAVQENERKRIGRELHDGVCQTLIALKIHMENEFAKFSGKRTEEDLMRFTGVISRLQEAIAEVRGIVMDLRPSVLDDFGLVAAVNWFCREFPERHANIHIETDIAIEETDIPESQKTVAFRVIQEALNNVARHSRADWARVALRKAGNFLELIIEDNGVGFNPDQNSAYGFGLTGMQERVDMADGGLYVESNEGSGTKVRAVLPSRGHVPEVHKQSVRDFEKKID